MKVPTSSTARYSSGDSRVPEAAASQRPGLGPWLLEPRLLLECGPFGAPLEKKGCFFRVANPRGPEPIHICMYVCIYESMYVGMNECFFLYFWKVC